MILEHITLKNEYGVNLRGYFTTNENVKNVCVLMLHGFTGNKTETGGIFKTFSRTLAEKGIASMRLDYMGNGESDKEFSDFDWDTLISDTKVMLKYITNTLKFSHVIVLGFSMGGALALELAKEFPEVVSGLLLWSPAVNIKEIMERIFTSAPKLASGNLDYLGWEINSRFLDSLKNYTFTNKIEKIQHPCMVIHGKKDLAVPFSNGKNVAKSLKNCEFILLEEATHGYNQAKDKADLFQKSLNFIEKLCYNMDVEWGG